MITKKASPEIFRYEAFNGTEGGLAETLHALEKLSRLSALAQRGVRDDNVLHGDDELLEEVATAVASAAMHARVLYDAQVPKPEDQSGVTRLRPKEAK
jgi:hypothetical protein